MFCTNCGAPVVAGQKFCNKCGAPVDAAAVNVGANPAQIKAQAKAQAQAQKQAQKQAKAQAKELAKAQKQAMKQAQVQGHAPGQTEPKKNKTGLIIAIILVILLIVSVLLGIAIHKVYTTLTASTTTESGYAEDYTEPGEDMVADADTDSETDSGSDSNSFNLDDLYEDTDGEEVLEDVYDQLGIEHVAYEYADVYDTGTAILIKPKNTVGGGTAIWNKKTVGELCDYIDKDVYQDGKKINRDMLYKLISIHVIDPAIVKDDHVFEILMKYCLIVTTEFGDSGAMIESASFNKETPNTYTYEVSIDGQTSTWVIDYDNQSVLLNDGKTEYSSPGENGMFSEKTMQVWTLVIDQYFGIN